MAIRERAPGTPRREQPHSPDTKSIASRVAGAVDNLQRDRQSLTNPRELQRRADMAMVAMLEVVAPVLPENRQGAGTTPYQHPRCSLSSRKPFSTTAHAGT